MRPSVDSALAPKAAYALCPPPSRALLPLTGHCGAVAIRIPHDEFVFQAAPAHALSPNQHQGFPAEGGHAGHLLVNEQLVAVKLCTQGDGITHWGRGWGWVLREAKDKRAGAKGSGEQLGEAQGWDWQHQNQEPHKSLAGEGGDIRGGQGQGAQHPPAFLVVKYIIRFFFFPERLPQRVPGHKEVGE